MHISKSSKIRNFFYILLLQYIIICIGEYNCLTLTSSRSDNLQLDRSDSIKNNGKEEEKEDQLSQRSKSNFKSIQDDDSMKLIENGEEEDGEEEGEDEDKPEERYNKFTWIDHNEDHGIYSQRSLMSTSQIKNKNKILNKTNIIDDENSELEFTLLAGRDIEDFNALKRIDYSEKEWQLMFRSFDMMFDSLATSILYDVSKKTNLIDDIISRLKPECQRDMRHIGNSAKKHKLWALRMLDSNGKLPSGLTYGRFSSPGDYEECLSVNVDENVYKSYSKYKNNKNQNINNDNISTNREIEKFRFKGKYCLIDFRLPLPERPKNKLMSIHEPVIDLSKTDLFKSFPEIANYSGYASVFYEVGYLHGFCIPNTCDVNDLTKSISKSLEGLYVIVNNTIDCEVKFDEKPPLRLSQIISIILLTIVFLNAFLASFVYYYNNNFKSKKVNNNEKHIILNKNKKQLTEKEKDNNNYQQQNNNLKLSKIKIWFNRRLLENRFYSDCFSIQTNFNRLTKPDPRGLTFVHYTRIVAMALTVITHTGAMGTLQAITKPADASNSDYIFRDFIPQMLANAFTSIQVFFFMAGFMLVISTYPSIKRENGYLSFVEYITKRAIRLMPGLAATIAINFLWPLFVDGPMLSYFFRMIVIPCEQNWYRTLGFISNFDHVEKMCLRHSYFSASDYQLHLIAFPLLILLYKKPTISLIIAGILTISGFVAQVIMILTKTVLPFMMVDYIDKEAFFNVVHYIHHPVWNHMSAFFYGFIIGYLVIKKIRINISEKTIKKIWFILMPIGIGSIFAPYFWNHYKRPIYKWQMVLYVIFDRFTLLTTCAWLSYGTMVLGRPPPRSPKKDNIDKQLENNKNLPEIITIENDKNKLNLKQQHQAFARRQFLSTSGSNSSTLHKVPSLNVINEQQNNENLSLTNNKNENLYLIPNTNSIPRQRSSPNIRELPAIIATTTTVEDVRESDNKLPREPLKTSHSNVNINIKNIEDFNNEKLKSSSYSEKIIKNKSYNDKISNEKPETETEIEIKQTKNDNNNNSNKRSQMSNLNTLCLVLSRLTFQLYLFNMVVLWIDVNHSKYYWFFSYYFIITKACAVYICSSIMAMIFFITLESPSLTIYILWIKSRAQARAKRQQFRENNIKQQQQQNLDSYEKGENEKRISSPVESIKSNRPSSQVGGSVQNFDGICMRSSTPIDENVNVVDKSALKFIDLSPSTTKAEAKRMKNYQEKEEEEEEEKTPKGKESFNQISRM